jgi:hypothetical protein
MVKATLVAIVATVIMAGSMANAQIRGMGRLNGKVTDDSGAPVDGVLIKLRQGSGFIEGKTDSKGQWALVGVARGNWTVSFEKGGFPTKIVKVIVERELLRTEPISIQLKKGA